MIYNYYYGVITCLGFLRNFAENGANFSSQLILPWWGEKIKKQVLVSLMGDIVSKPHLQGKLLPSS